MKCPHCEFLISNFKITIHRQHASHEYEGGTLNKPKMLKPSYWHTIHVISCPECDKILQIENYDYSAHGI